MRKNYHGKIVPTQDGRYHAWYEGASIALCDHISEAMLAVENVAYVRCDWTTCPDGTWHSTTGRWARFDDTNTQGGWDSAEWVPC